MLGPWFRMPAKCGWMARKWRRNAAVQSGDWPSSGMNRSRCVRVLAAGGRLLGNAFQSVEQCVGIIWNPPANTKMSRLGTR